MNSKNPKIKKLLDIYKEISLLNRINSVLQWDMNVNLPPNGAEERAAQSAYITELLSEKWQGKNYRGLVHWNKTGSLNTEENAVIRNILHAGKFYWKVPKDKIIEFSEVTSRAFMVWQKAKTENDFKSFLPDLKKVIDLSKAIADYLGYEDNPYDALLDLYEPGLTANDCKRIFDLLQPELTRIVKKITELHNSKSDKLIDGKNKYAVDVQKDLAGFVIEKIGYDLNSGRMDISSHPFTDTLGHFDVRITNRYKESDFREGLMGAMHETGHAMYEQGVKEEYAGTPLDGGVSLGIHESQSRFWENQIGRSGEFAEYLTPTLKKYFIKQLKETNFGDIYKLMNLVKPSFIRTEADEVTYNLHIALRFEIEEALINEKMKADDLPEIWREKMKKFLGVTPKTDREGVLQDVHWSNGMFGYFPTYTLGNLYAAQFANKMRSEIDVDKYIEKGNFTPVLSWLRKNIHQHGGVYLPNDLVKKVTGEELTPKYFLDYINIKYSKIYNL